MDNIIVGIHPVKIALQKKPQSIECLYALKSGSVKKLQPIKNLAKKHGVKMQWLDDAGQFPEAVLQLNHQNIYAVLRQNKTVNTSQLDEHDLFRLLKKKTDNLLILVLDSIQDPHNLGACLRVADGAGVDAVVVAKDHSSPVTAVVRKVAAGAVETVPLFRVTNLSRVLIQLKEHDIWITGSAGEADQYYNELDYRGNVAIVMGNEGSGIRHKIKQQCDYLVKIPMNGAVESLNVSVATGIMLYEVIRQRMQSGSGTK